MSLIKKQKDVPKIQDDVTESLMIPLMDIYKEWEREHEKNDALELR